MRRRRAPLGQAPAATMAPNIRAIRSTEPSIRGPSTAPASAGPGQKQVKDEGKDDGQDGVPNSEAVQWLPSGSTSAESRFRQDRRNDAIFRAMRPSACSNSVLASFGFDELRVYAEGAAVNLRSGTAHETLVDIPPRRRYFPQHPRMPGTMSAPGDVAASTSFRHMS